MNQNISSSFDSWLRQEGLYEEVTVKVIKRVLARQVEALMREESITKTELAQRMGTSRATLDWLVDPESNSVTLSTLQKAASAVGKRVRLQSSERNGTG